MDFIAVKDFETFQHYKGRTPPWIKFYNALLDDYRFLQLSDAARSQLMLIWLVASRHRNRIPRDEKYISEAIHCTTKLQLAALIESGWLYVANDAPLSERKQDASSVIALSPQNATLEGEVELEEEIEKEGAAAPPRVVLPKEATDFLGMFYEPALTEKQRQRYRDVMRQLYDALDPKHPGPKIRGGVRVKARSVEHMADEIRAVMKDPPVDRDFAIVFLLKRLTNPPKGPSVTEKLKREEEADRQLEERYHAAAKRAGIQWANENPEPYQAILAEVEAHYRGKSGAIVGMAKTAELAQRCSKAAEFPSFETWRERLAQPEKISA